MLTDRLQALRAARRLSQHEVAREIHVSRTAYSSYETGHRTPSPDILLKIARFYGTTTDYLLGNTDDPLPPPPLDPTSRRILENYRRMDERSREILYRFSVQEMLTYRAEKKADHSD